MHKKHKTIKVILAIALALVFTSCSSYFSAGMSGFVNDKDTGNPISNVLVCAYTDEGERDSAYNSYTYSYENEFLGNTALFRTHTMANGTFSIKSIKWNTTNPEYGKDGDNKTIYPLYFHKDYGLVKGNPFVITSDSINEGANQTLSKIREEKTISINVIHPTNESDYTYEYTMQLREVPNTNYEKDPDVQITKLENSNNEFKINYKKNCDLPHLEIIRFKNINQGTIKQMTGQCKEDLKFYTVNNNGEIEENISISFDPDKSSYYLFAKPIKFTYPNISGRITSDDSAAPKVYGSDKDNDVLIYITDANNQDLGKKVYTRQERVGDNNVTITNGKFNIDLSNETYTDSSYEGEYPNPFDITINFLNKKETITIDGKSSLIIKVLQSK